MDVMNTGMTESLEPVHRVVKELIDREALGKVATGYTDTDVMAVSLLYVHTLGSRFLEKLTDERASIGLSSQLADGLSEGVSLLTKQATGVDLKKSNTNYKKAKKG